MASPRAVLYAAGLASATTLAVVWLVRRRKSPAPTAAKQSTKAPPAPSQVPVLLAPAEDPATLLSICRLRWIVYVGELKRQNYAYVDNVRLILEDPLDRAPTCINLYIEQPEEDRGDQEDFIMQHSATTADAASDEAAAQTAFAEVFVPSIGCVRVHVPCPDKYAALFSLGDAKIWGAFSETPGAFSFFSRFMVHARYRGSKYGFANALYEAAARASREQGARFLLLNCTPALAPLYEARGFVRYKPAHWDDSMGLQVPMVCVLDDVTFLEAHDPNGPITAAMRTMLNNGSSPATKPRGFPDPAACRWLSKLLDTRPAVLTSSRCYSIEALRRFVDARGIEFDQMALFRGVSASDRAELLARCPNALFVLDLPSASEGTLISRVGDVRDESFVVLRGVVDVDEGVETLGVGAVVGETAFLSGDKRACTVRIRGQPAEQKGGDTKEAEGGALLLVTSRVGFQKAMSTVPSIAVRLLWNMATELSRKFSLRNELLKQHAGELEAKRLELSKIAIDAERKERRAGEMQELRDTAVRLRRLVAGRPKPVAAKGGIPGAQQQPRWKQSFDEGLEVWQKLEQQFAAAMTRAGVMGGGGPSEPNRIASARVGAGGPSLAAAAAGGSDAAGKKAKGVPSSATTPQLPSQKARGSASDPSLPSSQPPPKASPHK